MLKRYFYYRPQSLGMKIAILVIIIVFCVFLGSFLSSRLLMTFSGNNVHDFKHILSSSSNQIAVLKLVQCVQSIFVFIIPPLLFSWIFNDKPLNYLGLRKISPFYLFITASAIYFFSMPLSDFLHQINKSISMPSSLISVEEWIKKKEAETNLILNTFLNMKDYQDLAVNIFVMAFVPAIAEELMFRGVLQRLFYDLVKNIHFSIICSAFLFSALHMQFYGFLPRMFLGIVFGYMYFMSKSLWLSIFVHFLNNAIFIVFLYFFKKQDLNFNIENTFNMPLVVYIASTIVFALLCFLFYKKSLPEKYSADTF